MTSFQIFLAIYMGLLAPLFGALFSARLRRIETDISELRSEIAGLRSNLMQEIAGLRSDLTQVALAVGARPRGATQP